MPRRRLTPRVPLSAEAVEHATRRVIEVFAAEHDGCDVWEVKLCDCGCSARLRTTCAEWDPVFVATDPISILPW